VTQLATCDTAGYMWHSWLHNYDTAGYMWHSWLQYSYQQ